jgi:LemA protein
LEYLFSRANYVNKLENSADNIRSSISIYENKNNTLYNKANNLYLSFLNHEKEIHNNVANNNNESFLEINSVSTFNEAIQNYPNLKGDSHMSNLLNQIERSETELTNMKQHYNNIVSIYNEEISKLLMKAFTRKKRLEYYTEKKSMEF